MLELLWVAMLVYGTPVPPEPVADVVARCRGDGGFVYKSRSVLSLDGIGDYGTLTVFCMKPRKERA